MAYHKFVPVPVIDTVFILTAIFAAVSAFVGIKRLWNGMKAQAGLDAVQRQSRRETSSPPSPRSWPIRSSPTAT